jgi:hypothetical protein
VISSVVPTYKSWVWFLQDEQIYYHS